MRQDVGELFNDILRERTASTVDRLPECKSCDLRYVCGGRCHLSTLTKGEGITQVDCDDAYKEAMWSHLVRNYDAMTTQ